MQSHKEGRKLGKVSQAASIYKTSVSGVELNATP